jgi:hypothetical protein
VGESRADGFASHVQAQNGESKGPRVAAENLAPQVRPDRSARRSSCTLAPVADLSQACVPASSFRRQDTANEAACGSGGRCGLHIRHPQASRIPETDAESLGFEQPILWAVDELAALYEEAAGG